jgi:hypothetical protein
MSEPLPVPDPAETLADQRAGPGIVVLSASMQLLHMNRQASELAKQINVAEHGGSNSRAAHGVLPTALTELCGEIVKALHIRTEAKDWEQFEIKRVAGNPEQPVLLRGFGLPDRGGVQFARLVTRGTCSTTTIEYGPSQGKIFAYQS